MDWRRAMVGFDAQRGRGRLLSVGKVGKQPSVAGHLAWCTTTVQGRPAHYGTAGEGLPVLFLHGWALGHHTYKRALKRLVQLDCQVMAPALPGFGGTPNLPNDQVTFAGYAAWVAEFVNRLGCDQPLLVVGHSFGGAVAVKLAHAYPGLVRQLVLVNSLGASTWRLRGQRALLMSDRPLWDWGLRLPADLWPPTKTSWLVSLVRDDLVGNVLLNPGGVWRAATLARRADLTEELAEIRDHGLPVVALSADHDQIVPRASFEALCEALGCDGQLVPGRHSWLLNDPDAFARALARTVASLDATGRRRELLARPEPAGGDRAAS